MKSIFRVTTDNQGNPILPPMNSNDGLQLRYSTGQTRNVLHNVIDKIVGRRKTYKIIPIIVDEFFGGWRRVGNVEEGLVEVEVHSNEAGIAAMKIDKLYQWLNDIIEENFD